VKVCVAYTAVTNGSRTSDFIARFVVSWKEFPPGVETDLVVNCNGGVLSTEQNLLFAGLHAKMFPRFNDDARDISGHQAAARGPCAAYDMVLFCGESVYFHRAGWLKRFVETWQKLGPGFYGPFCSNSVRAHLNTTAFCASPALVASYPKVKTHQQSYSFEHGPFSMWRRAAAMGLPVRLVTWDGEWRPEEWRTPENILWKGDQTNCLMWCNHADRYFEAAPDTRWNWERATNQSFR
jgi:hypothetical protein